MSTLFKGEEFFLKGGEAAILLLHGFTASTQEVEGLGLALAEEGFTVLAPLLPGHNRKFTVFKSDLANFLKSTRFSGGGAFGVPILVSGVRISL